MQKSNAPTKLTVVFASGSGAGPVNTIPLTANPTPGGMSYPTGFTPVNMEPKASGGVPPYGADFNGLFQAQTKAQIWQQSGYMYPFDASFAGNANIGGYPSGSVLMMGSSNGFWLNQSDNNTASPDATGSTGWLGFAAAGATTINTTGGTTTPDPSVLGVTTLLVTGALTSNATIVLPLTAGVRWIVVNNTTGSYTLTVKGLSGSGVSITSGSPIFVFTDGTNYYGVSANLSGAYLPIGGTAVAATKLATARTIAMTGDVSWVSPAFDGTGNVTAPGTIATGAVSLAKMANFQANSLMGNPASSAAAPSAITLQNGLTFSGTNLGLGAITPSSVSASGTISGGTINAGTGNYTFQADASALVYLPSAGIVGVRSSGGFFSFDASGNFNTLNGALTSVKGISLGTIIASGNTDLSLGVRLYSNIMGFGITANRLNYVVGSGSNHVMLVNGTDIWTVNGGGGTLNGNLVVTGTINFGTSDAALKSLGAPVEPRTFHRVPYYAYTRRDTGECGWGPTAQDVAAIAPEYTRQQAMAIDGQERSVLLLAKEQVTMDTAFWAGRQVDLLWDEIKDLRSVISRAREH